ncbi:hypothetical protein [Terriglobus sp.]|uniref:hypothetical protein n=1 Tax=Terriglobus sp. TaxID=1889013 RepID=UPI003AFFA06D
MSSATPSAQSGSTGDVKQAQSTVIALQRELRAVRVPEMETDVPAAAQELLPKFQQALVRLSDDVLAGQPATATPKQVETALNALLPPKLPEQPIKPRAIADADAEDKPQQDVYGVDVQASVSAPYAGMLLVQQGFGIACGGDNVLLGYSNASGQWRRVLRWQAPPYKQVSDAFGDSYITQLLTVQRSGYPVLLVIHGTPWCSSTMSGFHMAAFEVDGARSVDKPFWEASHEYRRFDEDDPLHLKVTPDGFEVRASVSSWDTAEVSRTGIMRYRLTDAGFERVLPIAMNSRDSVNEWMSMKRDEAKLFTDAPAGSLTWTMFDTFTYYGKSDKEREGMPTEQLGEVRACSDSPKHFQLHITSKIYRRNSAEHTAGPEFYVQLTETGNGYRLHDTLRAPDPQCNGRVVLAAPED